MDLNVIEEHEMLYRIVRNSYPDAFINNQPTAALFMIQKVYRLNEMEREQSEILLNNVGKDLENATITRQLSRLPLANVLV